MKIPDEIKKVMTPLGLNFAQLVKEDGRFLFFSLGMHDDRDNVIPTGLPLIVRLDSQSRAVYTLTPEEGLRLTQNL